MSKKYPHYRQLDRMDCGPTCLRIIAKTFGKEYGLDELRDICHLNREGVSLFNLADAAEQIGFRTLMVQVEAKQLLKDCPLPCILHWNQEHYVVLHDIKKKRCYGKNKKYTYEYIIADPAHGLIKVDEETFGKCWINHDEQKGVALLLYATEKFFEPQPSTKTKKDKSLSFLFKYIKPYRRYVFELLAGMMMGSVLTLIFPFLTQVLVDKAIGDHNMDLVMMILIGQLLLFAGQITIDLIRNWILLHITSRVSISIISDFLMKLMHLPIKFFDIKSKGDITQRIQDHERLESFLASTSLNTIFSTINISVFTVILFLYSKTIFAIFTFLSIISILWVIFFIKRRKHLDYKRFQNHYENQNNLFEIIEGMQEIKLNDAELSKRWAWEKIQVKLFKIRVQTLSLDQYQVTGFSFINQFKNIIIMYAAASETIAGFMTLGMMLSVSYILGQTNGPLHQLVSFFRLGQDAKLSLERLKEIHDEDEGESNKGLVVQNHGSIILDRVSFKYGGKNSAKVLDNVSLLIPENKITAIVGASGSGKTTLLKLLLSFYPTTTGEILIGDHKLNAMSAKHWRQECGVVMQNGYIFSDTIANNIAIDGQKIDVNRLKQAIEIANLNEFIEQLPSGVNTKIGEFGNGLSGGQKQRILIARSVYKNPRYLFFDEATSSLDANNEKVIMRKLNDFFKKRTVLIIAHRLSTVKNADQIIVLDKGQLVEIGNHEELTQEKGKYFHLVKNQLELGT